LCRLRSPHSQSSRQQRHHSRLQLDHHTLGFRPDLWPQARSIRSKLCSPILRDLSDILLINIMSRPSKPVSLLDLPVEIRLQIYNHLIATFSWGPNLHINLNSQFNPLCPPCPGPGQLTYLPCLAYNQAQTPVVRITNTLDLFRYHTHYGTCKGWHVRNGKPPTLQGTYLSIFLTCRTMYFPSPSPPSIQTTNEHPQPQRSHRPPLHPAHLHAPFTPNPLPIPNPNPSNLPKLPHNPLPNHHHTPQLPYSTTPNPLPRSRHRTITMDNHHIHALPPALSLLPQNNNLEHHLPTLSRRPDAAPAKIRACASGRDVFRLRALARAAFSILKS